MHPGKAARVRHFRVQHDGRDARQVIDSGLRHRRSRIGAEDQRGVIVSPHDQIHRREFSGIETWIAAAEADTERVPRRPAQDHVGSGDVAVASHRHADELGEGVQLCRQVQDAGGVHVLAARHRQAHTEENHAKTRALHPARQVAKPIDRDAGLLNRLLVHALILDERAKSRQDLEVLAGSNLQKDVRSLGAGRFADVDQHHRSSLASFRDELALLRQRVLGEVPRVAFGRIAAPIDDEVRSVLHLSQGARDLATQLGGYLSGAVSKRGVAVDHTSDELGQRDRFTLRLARDVAQPVDERQVGFVQILRGSIDSGGKRRGFSVDDRVWKVTLRGVMLEPSLSETAGVLGLDDSIAVGVQLDVVTDAATKCARGVLHNVEAHFVLYRSDDWRPPGPGGMTNAQPSSRPGKLPRVRRGMYRPASICSHAWILSDASSGKSRSVDV